MAAPVSLPAIVKERSLSHPHDIFLIDTHSGLTHTYADVHERALTWAGALAGAGISANDTVVTMLPPCSEAICAWIGISWLRALEVSVNTGYRGRMLEYVLADSRATTAIVHADYLDDVYAALAGADNISRIVVLNETGSSTTGSVTTTGVREFLNAAAHIDPTPPQAHDIAAIIYTSGTTGPSKGVMLPWAQILATADGIAPTHLFGRGDTFYSPFPMFHMSSKGPLVSMAKVGGRFAIKHRFDTKTFWADVNQFDVTTTILLGAMVQFLLGQEETPADATTSLRDALMLPLPDDLESFERRFGLQTRTTFNMTETSCCILSDGYRVAHSNTCGVLRSGYSARIVDDFDNEVPTGEVGELILRSDTPWTLMAGYWGKPEATVTAWRNQWLHTGDAFRRDVDGNFYFVDRMKDAIRRRGENVSSAEVEADVNAHPDILESAAVAVPSDQSEDEIMVFVVPKDGRSVEPDQLVEFLQNRMAGFMIPRYIEVLDTLPKTPTQKIQKAKLRDRGIGAATFDRGDRRSARNSR